MRPLAAVAFVFALLALAGAQDRKPADAPRSVAELVADLGDPVFAVREKAQRELWQRGDDAIPALEKALQDDNPEVVRRARELLDKFAWGVRPDTPHEVLKLLRQFQAGDPNPQKSAEVRKAAILELLKLGPPGISVARALLGKELPADVRSQVVAQVTAMVRREVPRLLFEGKPDEAAGLVALHATGTSPAGAADYAVFQVLRGNLPAAIATSEAALKTGKHVANAKLILAHLYRANGDWAKARTAAADIPPSPDDDFSLTELLREEEGDWGKLADTYPFARANHPEAVRLSFLRLAGRQKEFDEAAEGVIRSARDFASANETFEGVIALLSNNRAADATKILLEKKQNLGLLAEMLIQQLRYKEALALLDATDRKQLRPDEKLAFDLRRARILMLVGNREDAVQVFNGVADGLRQTVKFADSASPITAIRSLVRTELRVGLKDLAAEHAAGFVADGTYRSADQSATGESAFEILFGPDATAGENLFWALRKKKIPGDAPGPTMIRVRELLAGKASKAAVDEALAALRDLAKLPFLPPTQDDAPQKVGRQLAVAAVCRAANRDADAEAAFKAAAELSEPGSDVAGARTWVYGVSDAYRPYVEWGDFLFDRGRFREAADRLLDGWKRFPDQPLLLFLSGKALVKAGDAKEGQRSIELSHWVALGQERVRGRFLDELVRRGEGAAARRETELVLRACWCRDHYFGNVMNQAARAAELNHDFATAEKCSQRSLLVLLKTPGMYFVETSAYMIVPHSVLVYRAQAKLAEGKVEESLTLAREALAVTPGHVDLISGMVTGLDKLGKKEAADALFGAGWKAYRKVLAEFPDGPAAKSALATLAANCRRELDAGLEYAKAAVKADPAATGYRETLAEVHFRRGERDKAFEVMTKLAAEDPTNRLYKRQLVRYRSGALDSPKPDRED